MDLYIAMAEILVAMIVTLFHIFCLFMSDIDVLNMRFMPYICHISKNHPLIKHIIFYKQRSIILIFTSTFVDITDITQCW